nr:hypothetical protein [Candidatus Woesearchaeota archaeon]
MQRNFTIKHKNKTYYIDYLNSDGQILGLNNRDYWEVIDEEWGEIEDNKLKQMLINFCIRHFNNYNPKNKCLLKTEYL